MIKKRLPIFIVGALLGVAFAVVYLQGRHTMQEVQKRPIPVMTAQPLHIYVRFDAPWQVIANPQNSLSLVEENPTERKILKQWTEKEILGGHVQFSPLVAGNKYRLQGFLQACRSGNPKECAPYFVDLFLVGESAAGTSEISLPYLPAGK